MGLSNRIKMSLVGLCVLTVTTLSAGQASAAFLHPEIGSPFGGPFQEPLRMAIDQSNGNIYVMEGYTAGRLVRIIGSDGGAPAGETPTTIPHEGTPKGAAFTRGVAVDSACHFQGLSGSECMSFDPSNGNVYVASNEEHAVDKFKLNEGKYEYVCQFTGWGGFKGSACLKNEPTIEETPTLVKFGKIEGVTVDTRGNVYIPNPGDEDETVYEFDATGHEVAKIATKQTGEATNVVVDAGGDVYVSRYLGLGGPIVEMKHVGPGEYEEQPLTGAKGDALAIDIASGTIYGVDPEQAGTDEYNAKLEFGAKIGEGYTDRVQAVAVDDATHHLLTLSEGGQVHAFGPGAVIPDVVLTAPSLAPRSVELRGTVNPDETVITGCEFELVAEGSVPAKQPCEPVLGTGHTPMGVGARFSGLVPNARYTERLAAGNSSGSNSTQPLYIKTAAALPTTNDAPPVVSAVTRTSAVLSGVVNPEHSSTTYHFLFGSSAAYGSATASISAGAELGDRTVVQRIEGLKSGTTYHFAVVAENQAGSSTSVDRSFTTSPPTPPSVSDVTVNGIQPGAASISGNVDADGLPTSYEIDFGSDTSYATRIGGEVAGASQALSLTLLYLEPGTTYHYRVVARNEDGEAASADQTFTTPRYPIVLPEVLPQLALPAIAFPAEKADADAKHKAKKAKPKKKSKPHGKFKAKSKHRKKK